MAAITREKAYTDSLWNYLPRHVVKLPTTWKPGPGFIVIHDIKGDCRIVIVIVWNDRKIMLKLPATVFRPTQFCVWREMDYLSGFMHEEFPPGVSWNEVSYFVNEMWLFRNFLIENGAPYQPQECVNWRYHTQRTVLCVIDIFVFFIGRHLAVTHRQSMYR